jgi:pimeloyl-ACP methyl ester carboxylesterase
MDQAREMIYRDSGPGGAPALIYVPGIHGDWTPTWRLRGELNRTVRLIELTYPGAPEWSLEDYAAALLRLFEKLRLDSAHLLAESFGSLVGWAFALGWPERVRSIIVAGGFCRTPGRVRVGSARGLLWLTPSWVLRGGIGLYQRWLIGYGLPADAFGRKEFFPAARAPLGRRAILTRLAIIHRTDLRRPLATLRLPVLYLGGAKDRIVPVRREIAWLERGLDQSCGFRKIIFPGAPHPILPARYREVARAILQWIAEHEGGAGAHQFCEE